LRSFKRAAAPVLGVLAVLALAACGSSSHKPSSTAKTTPPTVKSGTVQMVEGTFPQSLDPGLDYTTQGSEINWLVYTGLTTYAHANGTAGAKLIPGLCTALPVISNGGKTYTCTLRKGLVFSNGKPVKASDFAYTVERALSIPWGGSGTFIEPVIAGAQAYATHKASSISGITTSDSTGQITIHLTAAYGPFDNVLAFPALGLVPSGFPLKVQPTSPPPGVGPYMVKNIVANRSFDVVKNPLWSKMAIPGIPAGYENIHVSANPNTTANALAVLNGSADIFDWADTIPGSLLSQIRSQASSRFRFVNLGGSTYYIFLNMQEKPFSSQLAREAVVTALNEPAMNRLGGGTLAPACFFLPPDITGHVPSSVPCPYGNPASGGDLAKGKALMRRSGMTGQSVTVWSEERSPRLQWMEYYTQLLNQLGLHATIKQNADATYFTTIGEEKKLHPQTGFADWNQDFPNPYDFYGVLLDGHAILPVNNENFGETNDPHINAEVAKLATVPTVDLSSVASKWQALDEYTARKAYAAVFGYEKFPEFASSRIDYSSLVFQPIYGWDLSSFKLK
jgi:peptide/nickel transport system substrate-binding protein